MIPGRSRREMWGSARSSLSLPSAAIISASVVIVGLMAVKFDPVLLFAPPVALLVAIITLRSARSAALATLLVLPLIGLLRRASGSYAAQIDPLTLLGPGVAVVCVIALSHYGGRWERTPLSRVVTGMLAFGLLQALNPEQGGPVIGLVGAGLFVGPMVWFYVGHLIGDIATLNFVTRVLRVLVLVTAAYGTKQLIFGFTGFEDKWIADRLSSYAALNIAGDIRPFSTFASGMEYSYFLALGAVLFMSWRRGAGSVLRFGVITCLLVACFYAGSRSIFVTAALAVVLVAAVDRIRSLPRALWSCLAIGIAGLALLQLVPLASADSTAAKIRNRTVGGLTRPFDRESSTLGIHLDAFRRGLWEGVRTPLGHGAGTVNLAGSKLRGSSVSAEHDIPNVLIAYGWVGGILLLVLLVRVYRVIRACVYRRDRNLLGPAIFVLVLFGSWFAGELYAVSALVWFFMGSVDRLNAEARRRDSTRAAGDREGAFVTPAGAR